MYASAGQKNATFFSFLGWTSHRYYGNFKAQELANLVWAFAIVTTHVNAPIFQAVDQHIGNFHGQALANIAWSFAILDGVGASLFEQVASRI